MFHNFFKLSILSLATLLQFAHKTFIIMVEPVWKQIKWKQTKNKKWTNPCIHLENWVFGKNLWEASGTLIQTQVRIKWWPHPISFTNSGYDDKPITGGLSVAHRYFIFLTPWFLCIFFNWEISCLTVQISCFQVKWNWQHWAQSCLATINCDGLAASPSDLLPSNLLVDIPCLPLTDILYLTIPQFLSIRSRPLNLFLTSTV